MQFKPDAKHERSEAELNKLNALKIGATALKNQSFLPQLEREENSSYKTRSEQTILVNFTEKTVNAAKGLLFRKPLSYENLKLSDKDIDSEGRTLSAFAQEVAESGLWNGHSLIMVDAPSSEGVSTLAEEKAAGLKPYFTLVERKNIISSKHTYVNGRSVITEIIIKESSEIDGEEVEQYRKLYSGGGQIWQSIEDELVLVKEWVSGLNYIPITPFYTRRTGILDSKPMFSNIADLNVRHFQEDSMSWRIKAYAGNPILKIWGMTQDMEDGNGVTMSVNSAMMFSRKDEGDAQWLVYEGKELELFERSMTNIEQKIAMLGLSMLSSKDESKDITAFEKNVDSVQEQADLSSIAQNLEDALNDAYAIYCDMAGIVKGDEEIKVNRDFVKELLSPAEVTELRNQYAAGLIDKDYFWTLMENGGWFKNLDREVMKANLEDGSPDFAN